MRKLDLLYLMAKSKVEAFANEEKGEVNIVATVVLIGIAVALAIIFKDAITNLIKDLLNSITGNAKNAIK